MKDAADYLAFIKALIIANPHVVRWAVIREEAQGDMGLLRYRLALRDGGLLEMFERFQIVAGRVQGGKYSFHWQDAAGQLLKRWDNVPHHPELSTYPSHMHEGAEENVQSHEPINAEEFWLALLSREKGGKLGSNWNGFKLSSNTLLYQGVPCHSTRFCEERAWLGPCV